MTLSGYPLIPEECKKWWDQLPPAIRGWLTISLLEMNNGNSPNGASWRSWIANKQQSVADNLSNDSDVELQIQAMSMLAGLTMLGKLIGSGN